jgi:hypothetical protein
MPIKFHINARYGSQFTAQEVLAQIATRRACTPHPVRALTADDFADPDERAALNRLGFFPPRHKQELRA